MSDLTITSRGLTPGGESSKKNLRELQKAWFSSFAVPRGVPETYANCSETARFGTFPFPACIDTLQNTTKVLPFARLSDEWEAYLLITYREFAAHVIRDPHIPITVRDEQVCVPKT